MDQALLGDCHAEGISLSEELGVHQFLVLIVKVEVPILNRSNIKRRMNSDHPPLQRVGPVRRSLNNSNSNSNNSSSLLPKMLWRT
jgi:hypothetical protein